MIIKTYLLNKLKNVFNILFLTIQKYWNILLNFILISDFKSIIFVKFKF